MMSAAMSDEPPSTVLGGLPRTRPHRRSEKRAAVAAKPIGTEDTPGADSIADEPQPPDAAGSRRPLPVGAEVLGTAVQAAAELAEIGLSVSARALRGALSRLPRP
jgi:hypothetical protein